jgi:hypothetical protein
MASRLAEPFLKIELRAGAVHHQLALALSITLPAFCPLDAAFLNQECVLERRGRRLEAFRATRIGTATQHADARDEREEGEGVLDHGSFLSKA